jgi:hypothetical protein
MGADLRVFLQGQGEFQVRNSGTRKNVVIIATFFRRMGAERTEYRTITASISPAFRPVRRSDKPESDDLDPYRRSRHFRRIVTVHHGTRRPSRRPLNWGGQKGAVGAALANAAPISSHHPVDRPHLEKGGPLEPYFSSATAAIAQQSGLKAATIRNAFSPVVKTHSFAVTGPICWFSVPLLLGPLAQIPGLPYRFGCRLRATGCSNGCPR